MIEFIDVSKKYKSTNIVALDDVSFKVNPKEFVFIVGLSGVGKTTILRLIVREELPSSGKITVDGEDIALLKNDQIPNLRRKVGYIFQDFKLLDSKTVFENASMALEVSGAKDNEIKNRVMEVLETVGLGKKAPNYPYQLSGGEKQRLAIARALVREPKIILADEPTGMVDPSSTWEIVKLLEKINTIGTTVIMATHDFTIVDSLKKRVIELDDGKLVRDQINSGYARN